MHKEVFNLGSQNNVMSQLQEFILKLAYSLSMYIVTNFYSECHEMVICSYGANNAYLFSFESTDLIISWSVSIA